MNCNKSLTPSDLYKLNDMLQTICDPSNTIEYCYSTHDLPCSATEYLISTYDPVQTCRLVMLIAILTLTIIGITLNTFTFVILRSTQFRNYRARSYLIPLTFSDSLYYICQIFLGLGRRWIWVDGDEANWLCSLRFAVVDFWQCACALIIVLFTIERFIVVWFPFYRTQLNSRSSALLVNWKSTVGLVVVCLVISAFKFFVESRSVYDFPLCGAVYEIRWPGIWYIRTGTHLLPAIAIFTFNSLILLRLRRRSAGFTEADSMQKLPRSCSAATIQSTGSCNLTRVNSKRPKYGNCGRTLMLTSFTYLILALPYALITLTYYVFPGDFVKSELLVELRVARTVGFIVFEINFGVHFFIYYVSVKDFRMEVRRRLGLL